MACLSLPLTWFAGAANPSLPRARTRARRTLAEGAAATDVKKWTGYDKIRTSPSLSADGKRLYFGMGFDVCSLDTATMTGSHSHSASYKAEDCYRLRADVSDSSPAVAANGTIYIGDRDNTLTAMTIKPDGDLDLKWLYNHGFEGDIWASIAIAPAGVPEAGTLYFAHDQSKDGFGVFTALLDKPDINNTQRGDNIATVVDLSGADQSASGDFTSADNNTGPRVGVVLRYQDAKNHYRVYRSVGGSSQLRITKLVNGIELPLKSANIANPVVGTPFHIVGSVVGTTSTASMAGVQISVSDTTGTTFASGGVGVLVGTGPLAAHSADNFCVAAGGGTCP